MAQSPESILRDIGSIARQIVDLHKQRIDQPIKAQRLKELNDYRENLEVLLLATLAEKKQKKTKNK